MTPQEKALIDSVFDRLAQTGAMTKDAEAQAYIGDRAAKQPDAAYGLVQAVLIQEMALNHANTRIAQLEHEVAQAGGSVQGSSFLGAAAGGSSPWGARAAQPQPQPQPAAGPWGQPSGGGFLRNVASMAAGVAGGTLLADGLLSLFGGRSFGGYGGFGGIGGAGPWGGQPGMVENVENITVNNYGDPNSMGAGPDGLPQTDNAGYQDASFDNPPDDGSSGFDDGGGFDGGGGGFSDT